MGFGKTTIATSTQSVATHQFTNGAFNGVALIHAPAELWSLLFPSAALEQVMILANYDGAVRLISRYAIGLQRAIAAVITPLKTIDNFALSFINSAALGARKSARALSFALSDIYRESLDAVIAGQSATVGAWLSRTDELPALLLSLPEPSS